MAILRQAGAANPYFNDQFSHQRMIEEAMIAQQLSARGVEQQNRYLESLSERAQRQDENPVLLLLG